MNINQTNLNAGDVNNTSTLWQTRLGRFQKDLAPGATGWVMLQHKQFPDPRTWVDDKEVQVSDPLNLGGKAGTMCLVVAAMGGWVLSQRQASVKKAAPKKKTCRKAVKGEK